MDGFVEIDLRRVLQVLLKGWWILLLSAILIGGLAFEYTHYFIVPMYRTDISVYVNNSAANAPNPDTISTSDLTASQRLVNTYVTIITSNTVLNQVSRNIDSSLSSSAIRSMMSCSAVKDTEIFTVTITNKNPETAASIANAIADVVPIEIPKFLEGSSVKIVDYAMVPLSPFTPNIQRNTALGLVAGAFLAALVLILIDIFDKRITSEEDLGRLSDIPILGAIPDFMQVKNDEYGYNYTALTSGGGQTE